MVGGRASRGIEKRSRVAPRSRKLALRAGGRFTRRPREPLRHGAARGFAAMSHGQHQGKKWEVKDGLMSGLFSFFTSHRLPFSAAEVLRHVPCSVSPRRDISSRLSSGPRHSTLRRLCKMCIIPETHLSDDGREVPAWLVPSGPKNVTFPPESRRNRVGFPLRERCIMCKSPETRLADDAREETAWLALWAEKTLHFVPKFIWALWGTLWGRCNIPEIVVFCPPPSGAVLCLPAPNFCPRAGSMVVALFP